MKFSIIVPAYNEEKELPQTLEHILSAVANLKSRAEDEVEMIVVDNASTDATAEIAKSFGAKVVREEKRQIARARNRGAKIAQGEILLFCDADSHLHHQTLVSISSLMENPEIVGGGIRILPDEMNWFNWFGFFLWDCFSRTFKISGGTLFCRKALFDAVGGFSEKFYIGEEITLQFKMKLHAFKHKKRTVLLSNCPVKTSMRKIREFGLWRYGWAVLRCALFPYLAMQRRYCSLWYEVRSER